MSGKTIVVTEQMLADIQSKAMVYRGICRNLDTVNQTGWWITSMETVCENPPQTLGGTMWKYAIVEVFERNNVVFQRMLAQTGSVYRYVINGEPKDWISLT